MSWWGRRPPTRHAEKAAWMRANPEQWLEIATYPASYTACSASYGITRGGTSTLLGQHYDPPGAFEARTETTDEGTAVHARYIGGLA